jgi:methionine-rich copper-binding protein CopC
VRFYPINGDYDYILLVPGAAAVNASIVTPPASQSVNAGATATFTVVATGTGPLTYQWNFKGSGLAGQTGATLTVANAQSVDAGDYSVTVTGGTAVPVTSAVATLTVVQSNPPTVSAGTDGSGNVTITFTDKLYAADLVEGPYVEVVGATSPYPVTGGGAMKYYRAGR